MGYALARAALAGGHEVTLLTAPTKLRPPKNAKLVNVETSAEMLGALKEYFPKCDCLIMAAAVSDYTPVRTAKSKIKKTDQPVNLKLKPTTDILKWAGLHKKKGQVVVGFALEDKNIRGNADKKLREKNLDMVIANTPAAIGAARTSVYIKSNGKQWHCLENMTKATVAKQVVKSIEKLF